MRAYETRSACMFHQSKNFSYQRSYHGLSVPCFRSTPLTNIESASGASASLVRPSVAAAQEILGAATATEAIETALDMVVFRQELIDGTRAMLGTELRSPHE